MAKFINILLENSNTWYTDIIWGGGQGPLQSQRDSATGCRAISFAIEAGFRELVIEGDNDFVMRALSRSDKQFSRLGHTLQVYLVLT